MNVEREEPVHPERTTKVAREQQPEPADHRGTDQLPGGVAPKRPGFGAGADAGRRCTGCAGRGGTGRAAAVGRRLARVAFQRLGPRMPRPRAARRPRVAAERLRRPIPPVRSAPLRRRPRAAGRTPQAAMARHPARAADPRRSGATAGRAWRRLTRPELRQKRQPSQRPWAFRPRVGRRRLATAATAAGCGGGRCGDGRPRVSTDDAQRSPRRTIGRSRRKPRRQLGRRQKRPRWRRQRARALGRERRRGIRRFGTRRSERRRRLRRSLSRRRDDGRVALRRPGVAAVLARKSPAEGRAGRWPPVSASVRRAR